MSARSFCNDSQFILVKKKEDRKKKKKKKKKKNNNNNNKNDGATKSYIRNARVGGGGWGVVGVGGA